MAIITVTTTHTRRSLMNKTKSDLVDLLLTYMDTNGEICQENEQLRQRVASIEDHIEQAMQGIECAYGDEYLWPSAVLAVHTRLAVVRCVIDSQNSTTED